MDYKDTLLLPKTKIGIRHLPKESEPIIQRQWEEQNLYSIVRKRRSNRPIQIVHDGPPYANGGIHLGHLLNKILKDITVRFLTLSGYDSPFIPGWDCHGLPIETKVLKDHGNKLQKDKPEFLAKCRQVAEESVHFQRSQFQRLGILADWNHPYLTMDPSYKSIVLKTFSKISSKNLIERLQKPIWWCPRDRTALADAELTYSPVSQLSAFVSFPLKNPPTDHPWSVLAWTTTPWTLPANTALAINKDFMYDGIRYVEPNGNVRYIIVESRLARSVLNRKVSDYAIIESWRGSEFLDLEYEPIFPSLQKTFRIVHADFVTNNVGTGVVHVAPAHGLVDYELSRSNDLPICSLIDETGCFHNVIEPQKINSIFYSDAIQTILGEISIKKRLFAAEYTEHSYPHCWRCRNPVIMRPADQWFMALDKSKPSLRDKCLEHIQTVEWHPPQAINRIRGMISERPDWCLSRQRTWGMTIPSIQCNQCLNHTIVDDPVLAQNWVHGTPRKLPFRCGHCHGESFRYDKDIFDVWFESGVSHQLFQKDIVEKIIAIEGSDQHRGWFQSSFLIGCATDRRPFDVVVTHGFVADKEGKKFSKSIGKAPPIADILDRYGADIIRLFFASVDHANDVRWDENSLSETREIYRKLRVTLRFLTGNLRDYVLGNPPSPKEFYPEDRYVLGQLNDLICKTKEHYQKFEFFRVVHLVNQFCIGTMSSIYFEITKDRLYADHIESQSRIAAIWTMNAIFTSMVRIVAPILPHLASEFWQVIPKPCVEDPVLDYFPEPEISFDDHELQNNWRILLEFRAKILRKLESLRADKVIRTNLEAEVQISGNEYREILSSNLDVFKRICNVSSVTLNPNLMDEVHVELSQHGKCQRCWKHDPSVGHQPRKDLCGRCHEIFL